ncbi:hypothetical protein D9615_007471 [Tricholomella constricta]|uniref:J domain-containing protein n=1 Tax=Tricholomella constricta TaxID=117010 RepID=A0A8H5LXJ4_9AGAR|nr:hypothetical protein D9615_007471 [Tricholomella constricta]
MATNLYEILEVSKDATPEQIRKAYKKKALETHPDRFPPGTSAEEKAASEELFRKVNNAYEVLTDPQNRRVYDLHGVWPPPEPEATSMPRRDDHAGHRSYSHRPYQSSRRDFFESSTFGDPFFTFRDPFSLFEDVFGDPGSHHARRHHHERSWFASELSRLMRDDFDSPFGGFGFMGFPPLEPPSFSDSGRGHWKSERFVTTTINGVTQTLHQRHDWNGNEHVTRTYADGRELHTINGMEQPSSRGYIPHPSQAEHRYLPPATASRQSRVSLRPVASQFPSYSPPPYPGHVPGAYDSSHYPDRRDRRFSETPIVEDPYTTDRSAHDRGDSQHRRRWWGSRR